EMPQPAGNALLQRVRVRSIGEHAGIVVAFEDERVAARQARLDVRRADTEVGDHAEAPRAVADHELDRLARVVRHRKRAHLERADREYFVAVETEAAHGTDEALAGRVDRAERRPYGNPVSCRERRDPANVVAMLVRDEDRCDRRGIDSKARETNARVAHAEAAVDQDRGAARLDDEAVALAAAAQRSEAHSGAT